MLPQQEEWTAERARWMLRSDGLTHRRARCRATPGHSPPQRDPRRPSAAQTLDRSMLRGCTWHAAEVEEEPSRSIAQHENRQHHVGNSGAGAIGASLKGCSHPAGYGRGNPEADKDNEARESVRYHWKTSNSSLGSTSLIYKDTPFIVYVLPENSRSVTMRSLWKERCHSEVS